MKRQSSCETCEIRGYSPELCKFHLNKILQEVDTHCPHDESFKEIGKTVAVGAGVGLVAAAVSLAAVPATAIKAIFGHVAVVKMSASAGGSVAGAGYNVFRRAKKNLSIEKRRGKKKQIRLPLIA